MAWFGVGGFVGEVEMVGVGMFGDDGEVGIEARAGDGDESEGRRSGSLELEDEYANSGKDGFGGVIVKFGEEWEGAGVLVGDEHAGGAVSMCQMWPGGCGEGGVGVCTAGAVKVVGSGAEAASGCGSGVMVPVRARWVGGGSHAGSSYRGCVWQSGSEGVGLKGLWQRKAIRPLLMLVLVVVPSANRTRMPGAVSCRAWVRCGLRAKTLAAVSKMRWWGLPEPSG